MKLWYDIETDGLLDSLTKIHSLCMIDENDKVYSYADQKGYPPIVQGLKQLSLTDCIVAHNGQAFDAPAIKKLFPKWEFKAQLDTLIMSRLIFPHLWDLDMAQKKTSRPGSHALQAWGQRLGEHKQEFKTDWKTWSKEMQDYCEQDVRVLKRLYEKLESAKYPDSAILLEHEFAQCLEKQMQNGVPFDTKAAEKLAELLQSKKEEVTAKTKDIFPEVIKKTVFIPKKDNAKKGYVKDVPFSKIAKSTINLGSRQQIGKYFHEKYNWQPRELTDRGNPKLNSEVFEELPYPEAKLVSEYLEVDKRISQLVTGESALLEQAKAGYIYGYINHNGARTGRCSHSRPNVSQVPSPAKPYGKEFRQLFIPPPGKVFVGSDLKGIELRMLAHYLYLYDDGAYVKELLEGDIHTANQKAAGIETRDKAKTFIYACVTMDTTVLTIEGWRKYEEVKAGDLVLTYNQEDHVKEWKPILELFYYEDAEVIEMKHSQSFKVKTTPNHKWFVKKRRRSKTGRSYVRPYTVDTVLTTAEINQESNIIVNAPYRCNLEEDEGFTLIEEKYGHDWVATVLSMSTHERQAFLQGFLLADGYKRGNKQWTWNQNKGEIAEGALTASYIESEGQLYVTDSNRSHSPMIVVMIGACGHVTGQNMVKTKLENQPVWCLRTENSSFVMRQGNCITITGNSNYGAGNERLGGIIKPEACKADKIKLGKKSREQFLNNMPAIRDLIADVQHTFKVRGKLTGLDGRTLVPRAGYSALNTLLQGGSAVVVKKWTCLVNEALAEVDFQQHIHSHDEILLSCREEDAENVAKACKTTATMAGKFYNLNIEIEASASIGTNWGEVH